MLVLALGAGACGEQPAVLRVDLGQETEALREDPRPARWEIGVSTATSAGPQRDVALLAPWPSGDAQLPPLEGFATVSVDVRFFSAEGDTLVGGSSPYFVAAELQGRSLPVFVQRLGRLARPTGGLDGRTEPLLALVGGRLLVAGGGDHSLGAYDSWLSSTLSTQQLARRPSALAGMARSLVYADEAGALSSYDVVTGNETDLVLPSGLGNAELRGAPLLGLRSGGVAWLGPARGEGDSNAILLIDPDGSARALRSAATGSGLACAPASNGGVWLAQSTTLERLDVEPRQLTLPGDETIVALAEWGERDFAVATRTAAGTRLQRSTGCPDTCSLQIVEALACVSRPQLLGLGHEVLMACDDADGQTLVGALRQDGSFATVSTREPRRGARLLALGSAEAALVGGGPVSFERYRPLPTAAAASTTTPAPTITREPARSTR